jgi:cysteine desulfuration protein SufE
MPKGRIIDKVFCWTVRLDSVHSVPDVLFPVPVCVPVPECPFPDSQLKMDIGHGHGMNLSFNPQPAKLSLMNSIFQEKQQALKAIFAACPSMESKYEKIIEMGRALPPFPSEHKIDQNIVKGCQSRMYLHSCLKDGVMHFEIDSDALISAGLGALLLYVYNGEKPETVLTSTPSYLEEIGIKESLTPNRANGLYNIFLRMKQDALHLIIERDKK